MKPEQEPKYRAQVYVDDQAAPLEAHLVNRKTGEGIPDDEPVFVFRARDVYAYQVLEHYLDLIQGGPIAHIDAVAARVDDFNRFRRTKPERMKTPD